MRLNHIDFHVPNVAATADFLVEYFGLALRDMRGNGGLAILGDDSDLEVVLSPPIAKFGGQEQQALGAVTYHIGFIQPDRTDVDRLYARLADSNAEVIGEPREMRGGYVFYCLAPGHILIEVGWRP